MYEFISDVVEFYSETEDVPNIKQLVILDFVDLSSIQVGSVAVISNMIELLRYAGFKVRFKDAEICKARNFLVGSGFAAQYLGDKNALVERNFLPLRLVESAKSFPFIGNSLIPWMAEMLECQPSALASLKACLMEIYNNISDHSEINIGCSCAHFDSTLGTLTICVSDFGVGIPNKVRTIRPNISSDAAAIALACVEGFTTQSTRGNRGAGLPNLIRSVVEVNSGDLRIFSRGGIFTSVKNSDGKRVDSRSQPTLSDAIYPGTLIRVILYKNKFSPDDIGEKEYKWDE